MSENPMTAPARVDYAGAVYGSLLAASVVVSASLGEESSRPVELIVLVLATGIVFWLTHVYAHLIGDRVHGTPLQWTEIRTVAEREWPIAQAAVPPALAATIAALLEFSHSTIAWVALLTALAAQLGWALFAAAKAGVTGPIMLLSGVVNLILGLIFVILKTILSH
jgi:hypothetical protein